MRITSSVYKSITLSITYLRIKIFPKIWVDSPPPLVNNRELTVLYNSQIKKRDLP